jgi:signal transduction histidine kinase
MKIRTRLVLWYFFASLVLLLIFSLGTYLGMKQVLLNSFDDELDQMRDDISLSFNENTNSFEVLSHPFFLQTELSNYYIVLYNNNDKRIFESKSVHITNLDLPQSKVDTNYTTLAILDTTLRGTSRIKKEAVFRVICSRLYREKTQVGYVIIGQSFEKIYESMDKLLSVLLFSIGITTLLILVLSYFLTERSLKPIDRLIHQAQQISRDNLSERLDVENPVDEIGRLTNVLNGLLNRLQDAFNKEQEFMADAAHELKTPLTVLRTHWEDELSNRELPDMFKEKLVKDIETITRLSKLINNLLLLSNSEYSPLRADFEKLDLTELVKEVVSNTTVLAELKNQTINTFELSPAFVQGDRARLYQLFFNLIDNAIKYTPEGGAINLSVKTEISSAIVEIKDNGIGIPEADLPNIFRRFYRVHKDRSKKLGGNGLGLAIVKLITDIHNGEIIVESQTEKGSSFIIKLPLAA